MRGVTAAQHGSDGARRRRRAIAVRVAGVLVAVLALAFCARTLVRSWPQVRSALGHAHLGWLAVALVAAAAAMTGLGLLWWRCLHLFGAPVAPRSALAWYFGGELGKYLPGGVWAVLGRGELAQRSGRVRRGVGYTTTLISYAAMCLAAALVCGVLGPSTGSAWGWALIALVPVVALCVHPAALGRALAVARRVSRGRVDLEAPSWASTARLVLIGTPPWLFLGAGAVAVAAAFDAAHHPAQLAFAAVAAWIVGFVAVPVPAGAGVREVCFVVLCGLPGVVATTIAVVLRVVLVVVDGVGGVAGLAAAARRPPVADSRPA